MNSETNNSRNCAGKVAYAIAVLGAFLIVAFLVREMKKYTQPPALNANRAGEREAALKDIRNTESEALEHTGWIDPTKGVVRLRIADAMEMVANTWGTNAPAARSNLIARVEKANPPPPPPAPAKPSPLE